MTCHSRKEESVAKQHRVVKSITNENQHDLHLHVTRLTAETYALTFDIRTC